MTDTQKRLNATHEARRLALELYLLPGGYSEDGPVRTTLRGRIEQELARANGFGKETR